MIREGLFQQVHNHSRLCHHTPIDLKHRQQPRRHLCLAVVVVVAKGEQTRQRCVYIYTSKAFAPAACVAVTLATSPFERLATTSQASC